MWYNMKQLLTLLRHIKTPRFAHLICVYPFVHNRHRPRFSWYLGKWPTLSNRIPLWGRRTARNRGALGTSSSASLDGRPRILVIALPCFIRESAISTRKSSRGLYFLRPSCFTCLRYGSVCFPVPMFPGTDVPRTYVPRCLCSPVPICSPVPMFPGFCTLIVDN